VVVVLLLSSSCVEALLCIRCVHIYISSNKQIFLLVSSSTIHASTTNNNLLIDILLGFIYYITKYE